MFPILFLFALTAVLILMIYPVSLDDKPSLARMKERVDELHNEFDQLLAFTQRSKMYLYAYVQSLLKLFAFRYQRSRVYSQVHQFDVRQILFTVLFGRGLLHG